MNYQKTLEDKKSSEAISLFLALKTKNIFEVDHLVEKNYIPAILTRIEIAAKNNQTDKLIELKEKTLNILIDDIDKAFFIKDYNKIVEDKLPSISKRKMLKI